MKQKTLWERIIWAVARHGWLNAMSDEAYLKLIYKNKLRKPLDLQHPITFNEKLQWLKLYDHNPKYITLADKYAAREFIAQTIGEQYLFPLLGVWNHPKDIAWDELPEQFVLKCTHDSGGVVLCRNKKTMNRDSIYETLFSAWSRNFYYQGREWPYRDIQPRILAEPLMGEAGQNELLDYKLMVFNGTVRCSFVCSNRTRELHVTFFDIEWRRMPFERHYPQAPNPIPKPKAYEEMVKLAEQLAEGLPFVRVDFYEIDGHPYVGELTLYPGSGFEEFTPSNWDCILGDWLTLPERRV